MNSIEIRIPLCYNPCCRKSDTEKELFFMGKKVKKICSSCETCVNYDYNEYTDSYECKVSLDEDEMIRFLCDTFSDCPYYELYDEYKTVRKQN